MSAGYMYSPYLPNTTTSNFDRAGGSPFCFPIVTKSSGLSKRCQLPQAQVAVTHLNFLPKKQIMPELEAEIAAKKAELASINYAVESRLRKATERMVDDVYNTREAQQRLLQQTSLETEKLAKQKLELVQQKRELTGEKKQLATRNDVLQARTSRQDAELVKLRSKLLKAKRDARKASDEAAAVKAKAAKAKEAKVSRQSLRGFLSNLGNLLTDGQNQPTCAPSLPDKLPSSSRILDLD